MNSIELVLLLLSFFVLICGAHHQGSDYYLDELRDSCYASGRAFQCVKYQVLDYMDGFGITNASITSDSSVRIVEVPEDMVVGRAGNATSMIRSDSSAESEWMKLFKFFTRKVYKFFTKQGLAVELPDDVRVLEDERKDLDSAVESRGKKKKTLLLSLLTLLNTLKVSGMVHGLAGGIFLVQKTLLIGGFLLWKAIASVKEHCKKQHAYHVTPYYIDAEPHHKKHHGGHYHEVYEEPEDIAVSSTGHGYSGWS